MNEISWEHFEAVEMRAGTVVEAEAFPQARKPAYKITVDFGPEVGLKRTSAQVTTAYAAEDLIGRQVMGVLNFPPKQIGPVRSEFLLAGFYREDGAVILAVPGASGAERRQARLTWTTSATRSSASRPRAPASIRTPASPRRRWRSPPIFPTSTCSRSPPASLPVALRRGWTHGVLAQAVLPTAFAGMMWMIGRSRAHARHPATRPESRARQRSFGWLLALSYIGVISHVFSTI